MIKQRQACPMNSTPISSHLSSICACQSCCFFYLSHSFHMNLYVFSYSHLICLRYSGQTHTSGSHQRHHSLSSCGLLICSDSIAYSPHNPARHNRHKQATNCNVKRICQPSVQKCSISSTAPPIDGRPHSMSLKTLRSTWVFLL